MRAGVISDFCSLADVEAGLVRTALSRLVAKGFVQRSREGRASFYRLTEAERRDFGSAADLIYGRRLPQPDGGWDLALLDTLDGSTALRTRIASLRYRAIAANVYMRPHHREDAAFGEPELTILDARPRSDIGPLAARLWPVAEIAASYDLFVRNFDGIATARLDSAESILARILLVHEFRRVLLRDPFLPVEALPAPWPGSAARRQIGRASCRERV